MLALLLLAAALVPAANPVVHVMLHVPLAHAPLRAYRRDLRRHGRIIDHIGVGTWSGSGDAHAQIAAERVDHLEVVTTLRSARAFLPTFLERERVAQRQQETLGEIFGGAYGAPGQTRTRFIVKLQTAQAAGSRRLRLHWIFADNGHGGDSEYAVTHGVCVYSGVKAADAPRIAHLLSQSGFAYATEQETFITDDGTGQ